MEEKMMELNFVIAKRNDKYEIIGNYQTVEDALNCKVKFEESMHLLDYTNCKIIKGKDIENRDEIGFENNVKIVS